MKKQTNNSATRQYFDTDAAVTAAMTRVFAMDSAEGILAIETRAYSRMLRESIYMASATGGRVIVTEYLQALANAQYEHYSEMAADTAIDFDYTDVVRLLRTRVYAPLARFTRAHEAFDGIAYSFDVSVTRDKPPVIGVELAADAEKKLPRGKNGGRSKDGQQDTKQTRKADVEHAASMLPVTEQLSAAQAVFQRLNTQQKRSFVEWIVSAQADMVADIQDTKAKDRKRGIDAARAAEIIEDARRDTRNRKRREKRAANKQAAAVKQQAIETREQAIETRA